MAKLPSAVKITKDGVEYISNVDRVQYTLHELIRAALRDSGKLICRKTKENINGSGIKKHKGNMLKSVQYWVRSKQETPDLQIGYKPIGWYAGFFELGAIKFPKLAWLSNATKDNIEDIRRIQGEYLSAIEDENRALGLISDEEYEGSDEE